MKATELRKMTSAELTSKLKELKSELFIRDQMASYGNRLAGKGGTENAQTYPKCEIVFLDIPNIHVVRDAFHNFYFVAYNALVVFIMRFEFCCSFKNFAVFRVLNVINDSNYDCLVHFIGNNHTYSGLSQISCSFHDFSPLLQLIQRSSHEEQS